MEGKSDDVGAPQVEPQESAPSCKTTIEMEHLPKEVMKAILEKLIEVDPERPSHQIEESWKINFRSVAAYRQVCSTWRDFLDEILEQTLLSMIAVWFPPYQSEDFHFIIPKVILGSADWNVGLDEEIPCPPFLIGYNGSNPFPAKALEMGVKYGKKVDRVVRPRPQTPICGIDLITKFGHHLSVLSLDSCKIEDLDVLVTILEKCSNLKALMLRNFTVSNGTSPRPLPDLPKLKTLMIRGFYLKTTVHNVGQTFDEKLLHQWLVEPFADQLVTFDTYVRKPQPVTAPLTYLKQLTRSCNFLGLEILQQNDSMSLQRLCVNVLSTVDSYDFKGNIHDVFGYLDLFSKTLVDLFLNVKWSDLFPKASDDNEVLEGHDQGVQHKRQDPLMEELQRVFGKLPTSKVKFPHLKTLAFPYPLKEMHVMLFSQTVLPKFPALEQLQFLHFDNDYGGWDDDEDDQSRVTIAQFLEKENYWNICPKLKKITVVDSYFAAENARLTVICTRPTSV